MKSQAKMSGKVHLRFAASLHADPETYELDPQCIARTSTKHLRLSPTAVCVSSGSGSSRAGPPSFFVGSKDGSILQYDLRTGAKVFSFAKRRPAPAPLTPAFQTHAQPRGQTDQVLALAVSSDGRLLACGGKDKRVCVWDLQHERKFLHAFTGFKGPVSALAFKTGTNILYAASLDRSVRIFDLDAMTFVESLFGHQEAVLDLSALAADFAITAGGRDRTLRYWKVLDSSQLVFRAGVTTQITKALEEEDFEEDTEQQQQGKSRRPDRRHMEGSVDCVAMIDDHHFVSGGDSGCVT